MAAENDNSVTGSTVNEEENPLGELVVFRLAYRGPDRICPSTLLSNLVMPPILMISDPVPLEVSFAAEDRSCTGYLYLILIFLMD